MCSSVGIYKIKTVEEDKGSSETSFKVIIFPFSKVIDLPFCNSPYVGPSFSPNSAALFLLKDLFFLFRNTNITH